MKVRLIAAVAAVAGAFALPAQAQVEVQWWHSMGGALGERVKALAEKFNASQKDYKVVPVYKGTYPVSMTAAIAAFRAKSPPHIVQVYEVGTATMMAAKGAIVPIPEVMKGSGAKFDPKAYLPTVTGYYTDLKGNMLSFPFNGALLHQQGRLQEGRARAGAAEDLERAACGCREAQGRGAGVRVHHQLAVVGAHREFQRLAQRADRHPAERHGRLRHEVHLQFAAARAPPGDARRHGEAGPVRLRRAHQPG
jgi:hypothetical protein